MHRIYTIDSIYITHSKIEEKNRKPRETIVEAAAEAAAAPSLIFVLGRRQ